MFSNANVDQTECAEQGGILETAATDVPEGTVLAEICKGVAQLLGRDRLEEIWSLPSIEEDSDANAISPAPRDVHDIS
ncbi:hypothetical protein PMIN01_06429 [Paraphaeosphaeria minitans]|uniref:Uncharacterized protein n=1 Tax=Paraphaeosphaeria minitans TaxID=565426 RepID=A0A9P6KQX8_9PLEO|nr:hypothetical protein PMIN01_06429 [Paraphaeosphaeria minitans]